jgi:hypothetical protein
MLRHILTVAALMSGLAAGFAAQAQTPASALAAKNDYADPSTWLCRPGRQDACTVNLDATVITADGRTSIETFKADLKAPIDCFYVYPTVSPDPGANSTMTIGPEVREVVMHQFARFSAECRLFAPMYRQVTLSALQARLQGKPMADGATALAYNDILDAWNDYLTHDNQGRGVVLIGHSQGSNILTQLIGEEIEGKPIQAKMVSAILMGTFTRSDDLGGRKFKNIPRCHSSRQLGCVITFADFRADSPPPADSLFGQGRGETLADCVNPASLVGGSGDLNAYLRPVRSPSGAPDRWTTPPTPVTTAFVKVPGLLTGQCVSDEHGTYLAVTIHPTLGGARANDISGDQVRGGQVLKSWGLHLIDPSLHLGNLVSIVGEERKAYLAKTGG